MVTTIAKTEHAGGSLSPRFLRILYAEDFDDESAPGPTDEPPAPPPERLLTEAEAAVECASAVALARSEWETSLAQRRLDILAQVSAAIDRSRAEADASTQAIAEAAVSTLMSILTGMLPQLCAHHGPAEVRAVVDHVLPLLRSEPKLLIRVHPDCVAPLRQDLQDRATAFGGTVTVTSGPLEPGDLSISWENGGLTRDTKAMISAVETLLADLAITRPTETSPKRSLAYAQ